MNTTDLIQSFIQAALEAADPRMRLNAHLPVISADLQSSDRVWIVGAGKASLEMALESYELLGDRIHGGAVACIPSRLEALSQEHGKHYPFQLLPAAHPLPDERNILAAEAIAKVARQAEGNDLILALLSGGGSAHLTYPAEGLNLEDLQQVTQSLMKAGAPIEELNAVRKHLERLKGGRMLQLAYPARVHVFVLSDVIGDPLDVIASGPFAPDTTTYQQAQQILKQYGVGQPIRVLEYLESGARGEKPETLHPGNPLVDRAQHTILGSNRLAVEAVEKAAKAQGAKVDLIEWGVQGEARQVGQRLGKLAQSLQAKSDPGTRVAILGGETTVTVRGNGKGGRNQEMALAASLEIEGLTGIEVVCFSTDGIDGPTDAAGAWVNGDTCRRARVMGMEPREYLDRNDSYTFFSRLGNLILTGPTGTNVNDLAIITSEKS